MPEYSNIKKQLSNFEMLERELNLKQLQINRLLNITQAINNNLSAPDLYNMYNSFLNWEMGIKKMALYITDDDNIWKCASSIGIEAALTELDISDRLPQFKKINNIKKDAHPLIGQFDVVVPVMHKNHAIAYTFIGGFDENEDMYNKVQFITTITNIIAVAIENKRLFKRKIEQERLNKEMELASSMQKMLVPTELPSSDMYEFSSVYKPHLGVGGDYFDFINYQNDPRFVFCIGDISGKGLAAALLMANFQANLHALIHQRVEAIPFITALNKTVLKAARGEKFITFFIAEFNTETRNLIYINAGHNPPPLFTKGKIIPLNKGCTILGSFQDLPEIEVGRIKLDDEALIVTFTDGLTDVQNKEGDYFDEKKLYTFIETNHHLTTNDFNAKLVTYIDEFRGEIPHPDDFSLLTCKIYKEK